MAVGIVEDGGSGWKFEGRTDAKVGFYIAEIFHEGHRFAESLRVERIAVAGFSEHDPVRRRNRIVNHHVFGLGDCVQVQEPTLSFPRKGSKDPLGYYSPRLKVSARYRMPDLLQETDQDIELELAFLFTAYNKDPSHEPGGGLTAARIYPTLTFRVPERIHNARNPEYRRATAVQALFRLHFQLDDRGYGNQCGLFTDLPDIGPRAGMKSFLATHQPGSMTFAQAEKPVLYEVAGRGVERGRPAGWHSRLLGWDNIHQWSHPVPKKFDLPEWRLKGIKDQPPTPGLSYGAHLHWRWSERAVAGAGPLLPGGGQYGGPSGPGSPLIDARIRDQNIEFAIVDLDGWFNPSAERQFLHRLDTNPVAYMFTDFSAVWDSIYPPGFMMPSGDPLIWMSLTAWGPGFDADSPPYGELGGKSALPEWGGTLFAHGAFFPHSDAALMPRVATKLILGARNVQYIPDVPEQVWRR